MATWAACDEDNKLIKRVCMTLVVLSVATAWGCGEDAALECGAGTVERNGVCLPEATDCPDGTVLQNDVCASDPGTTQDDGLTCGAGTREENGACVPEQTVQCGEGTTEENGACMPLDCPAGTRIEGNACVEEPLPPGISAIAGLGTDLPYDDLAPFGELVGDRPIVALGESVHTSGGFYQAKVRMFQYLVEEKGFRAFAFESPWVDADITGRYVDTCEGRPQDAIGGLFGVWSDQVVVDVLEWMCAWNTTHPDDPVYFFGFDVQQPWADDANLRAFLQEALPDRVDDLMDGLATCDGVGYASAQAYYAAHPNGVGNYPDNDHDACQTGMAAIQTVFDDERDALIQATSDTQFAWGEIALVGLRAWQGQIYHFNTDTVASYEARDEAMAYVFERMLELRYPNTKTVIWAHNFHIARSYETVIGGLGGIRDMGSWLTETYGDDYLPIALTGYEVEVNWPSVAEGLLEPLPTEDSTEGRLHTLGQPFLFVNLERSDFTFLTPDERYELGISRERMVPREQFGGIFYLDRSPMMNSVFW
ncbi:MAG: erythromycin esterase family protein [Myxococcota bacterium]